MDDDQRALLNETPLVCTLSAEQRSERAETLTDLFANAERVSELSDGYVWRFPGSDDWAARLVEVILFERRCCPFFTFELAFEPNHGPISLAVRGPEGVKDLLGVR